MPIQLVLLKINTKAIPISRKLIRRFTTYWWILPLFIFYLGYILSYAPDGMQGDEPRYFRHANYLLHGAYTNPDDPEFLSGPGYPLVLMPFVALDAPLKVVHLLNSFLLIGAVFFFYQTLSRYISKRLTSLFTILFGLYPFTLQWLNFAYTEILALFLACAFIYCFCKAVDQPKIMNRYVFAATVSLAWLMLTKVLFAYVVTVMIMASLAVWLLGLQKKARFSVVVGIGSYLWCMPYLIHTYQLTGKMMYWSTSGGQQLYFHAAPFENEFGDWQSDRKIWSPKSAVSRDQFDLEQLSRNHLDFYQTLPYRSLDSATVTVERNQLLKTKAVEYLKANPGVYLKNSIASFNRLFFNFPFSYTRQHLGTVKYVWVNMFIVVLGILFIYPALVARRLIPFELWLLILLMLTYIGALSLLNGWVRHLVIMTPTIFFFLAFMFGRVLEIKINR